MTPLVAVIQQSRTIPKQTPRTNPQIITMPKITPQQTQMATPQTVKMSKPTQQPIPNLQIITNPQRVKQTIMSNPTQRTNPQIITMSKPIQQQTQRTIPQQTNPQTTLNTLPNVHVDEKKESTLVQNERTSSEIHLQKRNRWEDGSISVRVSSYALLSLFVEIGSTMKFHEIALRTGNLIIESIDVEGKVYSLRDLAVIGEKYLSERGYGDDEQVS